MKKSILFLIFVSFLNADIYSKIKDQRTIVEELKDYSREERKVICLNVMNKNEDLNPKLAFSAGNCLLYNGYGEEAIPLFTKYLYNGYNKKYFNNRIGYGWLHSADWYKVGGDVLSEMTGGLSLEEWIQKQIKNEIYKNTSKYSQNPLALRMSLDIKSYYSKNPMSEKDKIMFKDCKNIELNINNISCSFKKENSRDKRFMNCKEYKGIKEPAVCLSK